MERHVLIVPPTGLLEVVHGDRDIDEDGTLRQRNQGIMLVLSAGSRRAVWLGEDTGQLNPRARWVWNELCGVEVVFTGAVIFTGISPPEVVDLVARLSQGLPR